MYQKLFLNLIISLFMVASASAGTMLNNTDSGKPLKIEADTAEFDRQTGLSSYINNVKIDQGTTHVKGNKVTTKQDKTNSLEEIIIYGTAKNLAYYETLPEPGKPKLIAIAKTIKYYPKKRYVILLNQANITQGDNSITGEHIEYDIEKQKMRAAALTNDKGEKTRTTIIINPEQTS